MRLLVVIGVLIIAFDDIDCVLYVDEDYKRMLDVSKTIDCRLYTKLEEVNTLKLLAHTRLPNGDFDTLVNDCFVIMERHGRYTYPGTRWCGPGNIAHNISDFGVHVQEDRCCQEHDLCPKYILAKECKYNICNTSIFTCSYCGCDLQFQKCLKRVNTSTGDAIGMLYFNTLGLFCYEEDDESPPCPIQNPLFENVTKCSVSLKRYGYSTHRSSLNLLWETLQDTLVDH